MQPALRDADLLKTSPATLQKHLKLSPYSCSACYENHKQNIEKLIKEYLLKKRKRIEQYKPIQFSKTSLSGLKNFRKSPQQRQNS